MVDVGGDHGTSCRNLVAHKLGGDIALDAKFGIIHILAYRHIFHLGCDDTLACVVHLGHPMPLFRHSRIMGDREAYSIKRAVGKAFPAIRARYAVEHHRIVAALNPLHACARQPQVYVMSV